jgi:hypothetical protein
MSTGSSKPDICFWPHLLENDAKEGGLVFHNNEGHVTIDKRTFPHDEEITDFVFSEVFVANRPRTPLQTLDIEIDGATYSYTWNHSGHLAWWWFGVRPILEVKNTATGETWLFQYQVFAPFDNRWLRLTPMRNAEAHLGMRRTMHRLRCLGVELVVTGIALGMYYGLILMLLLFLLSFASQFLWLD